MKEFKFKKVGHFNTTTILDKLKDSDWNEWTFKQDNFEVHGKTKNLPIIKNEKYDDNPGTKTKYYRLIEDNLEEILKILKSTYGTGKLLSVEIAKLPAGSKVPTHVDQGHSLKTNPRIHLVLQTSKDVIFTVDGEEKNMKVGEMWEINNTKTHSVFNQGTVDRIHLILDYKIINIGLL